MIITTVTRTYSKSINTRTYGAPESWVKIEATLTARCESGDDAAKVSAFLYEQVKSQVIADTNVVITKIREGQASAVKPA
jgi:hypothetical protein